MVSVIVPVYNVEKYLPKCIESICGQTMSDLEIILVDDGSTDRSGVICDEYAGKDSRIVVIHKGNGGLVSARQTGLEAASGAYVGYVDSDDWIDAEMYEEMLAACERDNADIAISLVYLEYGTKHSRNAAPIPEGVYDRANRSMDKLIRNLFYSEDYGGGGIAPNLCSKLFRKDLLSRFQFRVDQRIVYGEDAACTYPCLVHADRVVMMDKAYYHYCIRGNSISNSVDERYFERISPLYHCIKDSFAEHPAHEMLIERLNYYMLELIVTGVNKLFGFGFGVVVPTYFPPADLLPKISLKKIVLYGAGAVGQSYARLFQQTKTAEVVGWIDRQWEQYREKGLPVQPITVLEGLEYDGVLVAVSEAGTAEAIKKDLLKRGVPEEKIFYDKPQWLLQALDKGQALW